MEFQFPANPQVGDTVENPTTGTSYIWSGSAWKVNKSGGFHGIYEGATPPASGEYKLWWDADAEVLKYFYCDENGYCEWRTTAFSSDSTETLLQALDDMSNVILDLKSKVESLELTSFLLLE